MPTVVGDPSSSLNPNLGDDICAWLGGLAVSVVEVTLTAIHCCLGSSHPGWLAMA